MKANDLMIGDWVNFYDAQAYKVTSIHINNKGCAVRLEFDEYIVETWAGKIEPIPLTEEILKANGFEDATFGYGRHCLRIKGSVADSKITKYYSVEYHPKGCYPPSPDLEQFIDIMLNIGSIRLNCYYVHELQHALRLCGLNELADNFKVTTD